LPFLSDISVGTISIGETNVRNMTVRSIFIDFRNSKMQNGDMAFEHPWARHWRRPLLFKLLGEADVRIHAHVPDAAQVAHCKVIAKTKEG
jgi:hypothetical protein